MSDSGDILGKILAAVQSQGLKIDSLAVAKPEYPAITFRAAFEKYGETLSFKRYRQLCSVLKHVLSYFGKREVSSLRRKDWTTKYIPDRQRQTTRLGGAPAVATLNQELTQARAVLNFLVREELAAFNPWQGIKKLSGGHRRKTVITEAKFDEALDAGNALGRTFATVLFWTGTRSSEARQMRWNDIDWENGRIWIPSEHVKTRESRWAPMPSPARNALKNHPRTLNSPWVFASPRHNGVKPYTRCRLWQLARVILDELEAAPGDGNVHPHDTRHSMVTRLTEAGVNSFTAMKLVGHNSAAEHWRYNHLTPKQVDDARELLERGSAIEQRKPPQRARSIRGSRRLVASR
jgi:integrase